MRNHQRVVGWIIVEVLASAMFEGVSGGLDTCG